MKPRYSLVLLLAATALLLISGPAPAEEGRFELGLRFSAVGAGGEPTNDLFSTGLVGRYHLSDRWLLGFAVDHSSEFDFERPAEILGLVGDPAAGDVDTLGSTTALTAWIERVYPRTRVDWFWTVGLGAATVDVDPVSGPLASGGSYDLTTDVGTEILACVSGGLRVHLGSSWALEAALRFDQHFTDWTVTDQLSGTTGQVDDYLTKGGYLGINFRF